MSDIRTQVDAIAEALKDLEILNVGEATNISLNHPGKILPVYVAISPSYSWSQQYIKENPKPTKKQVPDYKARVEAHKVWRSARNEIVGPVVDEAVKRIRSLGYIARRQGVTAIEVPQKAA